MTFTLEEKLEATRRELKYRQYVYQRRVEAGKMTPHAAKFQIAVMEEIVADYERLVAGERLL